MDTSEKSMTDEELIGYCQIHCQTPRALFHVDMIGRLYKLAGWNLQGMPKDGFIPIYEEAMNEVIKAIRVRQRRAQLKIIK